MEGTNLKEFKEELLNRPNIRREYEALNPKYDIIQAIITRRNEMSLSQRQLASLVGMRQPAICRLERGDRNITLETLFKVADVLNLEIGCKLKSRVKI